MALKSAPVSTTLPSASRRVPLTPAAMHKRGFITEAEQGRLEAYISAVEAYEEAFGPGPGLDSKVDDWRRTMEKLEQAKRMCDEAQQREAAIRSTVTQAARDQAGTVDALLDGPVGVLLENDPERLRTLQAMVAELRSAADHGAPPDVLGGLSRHLSSECLRLRSDLREGG